MTARQFFIGAGVVNWRKVERVNDRYGTIKLFTDPNEVETVVLNKDQEGKRGKLVAVVRETRESYHVGDSFHGVYPETPQTGERIILESGTLFFEKDPDDDADMVGLKPDDNRKTLWLDIRMLYRVHYQTVDLFFER